MTEFRLTLRQVLGLIGVTAVTASALIYGLLTIGWSMKADAEHHADVAVAGVVQRLDLVHDHLSGQIQGVHHRVDELTRQVDGVKMRVDGLEKKVQGLEQQVQGVNKRMDAMEDHINSRFDSIEDRFDLIEELLWRVIERTGGLPPE